MRILVFNWRDLTNPSAGGAEVYVESVLTRWAAQGHHVTLFCAAHSDAPDREHKQASEFSGYDIHRAGNRFSVYREARRFYAREGVGNYDLVLDSTNTRPFFAHEFVADAPTATLCYQVAREIWSHETPWPAAMLGRYVLEPRWLRRLAGQQVLTISQSSKESLEAYGVPVAAVLPVGLEIPRELLDESRELLTSGQIPRPDEPVAVFCARLVSSKRPEDAIEAFVQARRRLGSGQLWVLGSGPLETKLRRRAPEGVSFFGRVSQAEKFARMAAADALVATSVREGWGLTVSEAAAVGTSAIAYDVAGLRDSVTAAEGQLTEPNPQALAKRLVEFLPRWHAAKPIPPRNGAAATWDEVANTILRDAVSRHERRTDSTSSVPSAPTSKQSLPLLVHGNGGGDGEEQRPPTPAR